MENAMIKLEQKRALARDIMLNNYSISEYLECDTEDKDIIDLLEKVELKGDTLDKVVEYAINYSPRVLEYVIGRVSNQEKVRIIKKVENRCIYSTRACIQAKEFIEKYNNYNDMDQEQEKEYNKTIRNILECIFKKSVTYENAAKELKLSPEYLIIVFWEYKDDMKQLKKLIEETIYQPIKHYMPDREYLYEIAAAYGTVYKEYKNIDLKDFIKYFIQQYLENKAIAGINTGKKVLKHEQVYNDNNVEIYYVNKLNGLFINKKEANIFNDRFYIYPEQDSEGNIVLNKRENISPFDLYEEVENREKVNGKIVRYDWPTFDSDNFVDLSFDDSLSEEEQFNKTANIIESEWTLRFLINVERKAYKKGSNK